MSTQLLQPFDARNIDPTQMGGSLPVGRHPVIIEKSEIAENSAKDGGFLALTLKIIDGPQAGQTGVYRLNLYNKSPQACDIANRQLSAICHVTGVFQVNHADQLHNIPFLIEVDFQKGDEARAKGYTEVKKVFDRNGNEPGKPPAQQNAQPAGAGFGQQPQQPQQPQQQPQQQPATGAAWGGAPAQGQPAAQQPAAGGAAWGQGQPQQQPAQQQPAQGQQPAWGAPQGQQPAQQQPAQQAGGWQQAQGAPAAGGAPWGQR